MKVVAKRSFSVIEVAVGRYNGARVPPSGDGGMTVRPAKGRLQLLHRRWIEVEDSRRVEAKDVSLGLLREERQVGDLLRQIEIEMRPVRCVQKLGLGLDHVERTLKRLEVVRFHRLRRVPAMIAHVFGR